MKNDLNNFHRFLHLNQVLLECIKPLNTQHIKLQVLFPSNFMFHIRDVTILKKLITSPRLQNTAVLLKKKKIYFELSPHTTSQLTIHIIFLWLAVCFGVPAEGLVLLQRS